MAGYLLNNSEFDHNITTVQTAIGTPASLSLGTVVFCVTLSCLAVFGTVGNTVVILMIVNLFASALSDRRKFRRTEQTISPVFVYVLALSIVDLLVMLHLPLLVVDIWLRRFPFGTLVCKLYMLGEVVNKMMSTFMLTVLSGDRFIAVCYPVISIRLRRIPFAVLTVLCSAASTLVLMHPIVRFARVRWVPLTDVEPSNVTDAGNNSDSNVTAVPKCTFVDGWPSAGAMLLYSVLLCYLLPAVLMVVFYTRILLTLDRSQTALRVGTVGGDRNSATTEPLRPPREEHSRMRRVTVRVLAVVAFYFGCWTPYWTLQSLAYLLPFDISTVITVHTLSVLGYSCHVLIAFNSATNPILYAMLNRELLEQHRAVMQRRRHSWNLALNSAIEKSGSIVNWVSTLAASRQLQPPERVVGGKRVSLTSAPNRANSLEVEVRPIAASFGGLTTLPPLLQRYLTNDVKRNSCQAALAVEVHNSFDGVTHRSSTDSRATLPGTNRRRQSPLLLSEHHCPTIVMSDATRNSDEISL